MFVDAIWEHCYLSHILPIAIPGYQDCFMVEEYQDFFYYLVVQKKHQYHNLMIKFININLFNNENPIIWMTLLWF